MEFSGTCLDHDARVEVVKSRLQNLHSRRDHQVVANPPSVSKPCKYGRVTGFQSLQKELAVLDHVQGHDLVVSHRHPHQPGRKGQNVPAAYAHADRLAVLDRQQAFPSR